MTDLDMKAFGNACYDYAKACGQAADEPALAAAIEAYLSATQRETGAAVKPPEWRGDPVITLYADTIVGCYRIDSWTPCWSWSLPGKVDRGVMCKSIAEAQNAAQADYEQRIRSALA